MQNLFGKIVVIYGPVGAGKSTVARAMAAAHSFVSLCDDYDPAVHGALPVLKARAEAGAAVIVVVNVPSRSDVPTDLLLAADIELVANA